MIANDMILVSLIIVLVILVVYQSICRMKEKGSTGDYLRSDYPRSDYPRSDYPRSDYPRRDYFKSHHQAVAMRQQEMRQQEIRQQEMRQMAMHQQEMRQQGMRQPEELRPEQIAEAEREQWLAATEADHTGSYDPELSQDMQSDTMQYHTAQPSIDYSGYITDLVADPRTRENHQRWAEEMKPWSGTAMTVDNMDEAMEASTDFIGLRRPQSIGQNNPLQLTERDGNTFSSNAKFNFKG